MLRFKNFFGTPPAIEQQINDWLAEYEPDVTQMAQTTASDGQVAISFLFEESFRGQERRMGKERGIKDIPAPVPARDIPDKPLELPSDPIGSP